jgi:hypothetical protein
MKKLILASALILAAVAVHAQPFNVRGDFNSWGEAAMNDDGDGTYSLTINGQTPGAAFNWKVAFNDWASSWPGSADVRSVYDGTGSYTFHFKPGSVADGWSPADNRVGYADPGHGWELMGAFNGWSTPVALTSLGNGVFSTSLVVAGAGSTEFKFRKAGDWDISIGQDFGRFAPNASLATINPNELVQFTLDLPNGRWQAVVVPEPASLGLLGLGAMLLAFRRK